MATGTRPELAMTDDEQRFVEINRSFAKPIQAYCARRTAGSQVADAVAETFRVAWRRIDQVPDGETTLPWLYGVAYRVLSHQWRHKARTGRLIKRLQGLADLEGLSPEVLLIRSEEHRAVLAARPACDRSTRSFASHCGRSCPTLMSPWCSESSSRPSSNAPTAPAGIWPPSIRS